MVAAAHLAHDAQAASRPEAEVAAVVGGAPSPGNVGGANPLGLGIGGRAGVAFSGFYGGVSAINYFGGTGSTPTSE